VKLEKDELESAMNEAKKEAKEIENKNKVRFTVRMYNAY